MTIKNGMGVIPGFLFSGISLDGKRKNYGLIASANPKTIGTAAYTKNDLPAAPVIVSKEMDAYTSRKRAILVNSGQANALTGKKGIQDARRCLQELGRQLGIPVQTCYMASTGVIGRALNMKSMLKNMPDLVRNLSASGSDDFAEAILTTDTRPKSARIKFNLAGKRVTIAACVKGAGMIMPNMATMLCFTLTDAHITRGLLRKALRSAVEETFNSLSVDSDTSTNDSVFMLASGEAGNAIVRDKQSGNFFTFRKSLSELYQRLAWELISDAEGVTKKLFIHVRQAASVAKARAIAFSVANSPLVKTAFFGEQLNWGRIAMAVGKTMTGVKTEKLDIRINGYEIVEKGVPVYTQEVYKAAEKSLKREVINIEIKLNQGSAHKRVLATDLSLEYVKINANYIS
jgi:glutamate N-acetyltransferase/amino-acid N-acetyltransferase